MLRELVDGIAFIADHEEVKLILLNSRPASLLAGGIDVGEYTSERVFQMLVLRLSEFFFCFLGKLRTVPLGAPCYSSVAPGLPQSAEGRRRSPRLTHPAAMSAPPPARRTRTARCTPECGMVCLITRPPDSVKEDACVSGSPGPSDASLTPSQWLLSGLKAGITPSPSGADS